MTDRDSILKACEDRPGDRTQLLVAAVWMAEQGEAGNSTVLACSALMRSYRDLLSQETDVAFIHLSLGDQRAAVVAAEPVPVLYERDVEEAAVELRLRTVAPLHGPVATQMRRTFRVSVSSAPRR